MAKITKITMKERILQFVESKGSARFTEIQRFIVDLRYGQGTYDAASKSDLTWSKDGTLTRKANPYRGYFSSAFDSWTGYLMHGKHCLVKNDDGSYSVYIN